MGVPQILLLVFLIATLCVNAREHGNLTTYSFRYTLIGIGIVLSLLYWGGFFQAI